MNTYDLLVGIVSLYFFLVCVADILSLDHCQVKVDKLVVEFRLEGYSEVSELLVVRGRDGDKSSREVLGSTRRDRSVVRRL